MAAKHCQTKIYAHSSVRSEKSRFLTNGLIEKSRKICGSKSGGNSEIIAIFPNSRIDSLTNAEEYGPSGAVL